MNALVRRGGTRGAMGGGRVTRTFCATSYLRSKCLSISSVIFSQAAKPLRLAEHHRELSKMCNQNAGIALDIFGILGAVY